MKHSAALWRSFRGESLYDLKTRRLPTLPSHPGHTPTHLTPVDRGGPVTQPIDSLALNLNLGATGGRGGIIKGPLSLPKTDCATDNTCSLSLIPPFTGRTTYPRLSPTFRPFSSRGMDAFPVHRGRLIYPDGSPDDNNLCTPPGVTQPVLETGSQRSPQPAFNIFIIA